MADQLKAAKIEETGEAFCDWWNSKVAGSSADVSLRDAFEGGFEYAALLIASQKSRAKLVSVPTVQAGDESAAHCISKVKHEVRQMLYQGYSIGINHFGNPLLLKDGDTVAIINEVLPYLSAAPSQPVADHIGGVNEMIAHRNFCQACGKRTPEGSIHTCAPAYAVEQADKLAAKKG